MPSSLTLAPLANLPGVCEILGLGRFRENPEHGLEAQVEVCLQTGISAFGPAASSSVRWIGVGQMNLLVPGNRFNGGKAVGSAKMDRCQGKMSLEARRTPETLGNGSFSNSPALPLTAKISPAPGWLLNYTPSSGSALRGGPKLAFLPATELIRALFASSSVMLKQLIDGRRDPTLFPSRFFVDRQRCAVGPDGDVVIYVDRKIEREDALVLAALFADQSGRLRQFHDQIHQQLSTEPGFRDIVGAFVEPRWPWDDPVELEFEGRWFNRVNGSNGDSRQNGPANRFVISRITKISFPSRPNSIEIRYPSDTITELDMPPPAGRSIPATQRAHLVRSDKVPDTARKTAKSDTAGTEFSFAADIPISWTPGHIFLGRKDSGMLADPMDGETFLATDDPASGGDKATGALNFQRASNRDEGCAPQRSSAEARRITWRTIEQISAEACWTVSYWGGASSNPRPIPYTPQVDAADPPLIAVIDKAGTLRAVADLGSGSDGCVSLGVLAAVTHADATRLAGMVMSEAERRGWKWIDRKRLAIIASQNPSGKPSSESPDGKLKIRGHRRPQKCWSDEGHYKKLLAKWLAD